MKKIKKIVLYAAIVIVGIGVFTVVKSKLSSDKKGKPTTAVAGKTSVEVQEVKTGGESSGDTYKATLEAYNQGVISSETSAKVITVSVENGQYVNAGDTIAKLDDSDVQNNIKAEQSQLEIKEKQLDSAQDQLNSAQVAMEKLKVNVDDAKRNYDRQKILFDNKAISQSDLDAAEKTLNSAQADYDSGNAVIETATANIETAKANVEDENVKIASYQTDLDNTVIKAPISGVISDKSIDVGQVVAKGSALAKVNDISSVYATIQVPQDKINDVKTGEKATITIDGNDENYNGAVENIDLSADTSTRVFNCKIKIDNEDKSLLPGVYGNVNLSSDKGNEMITVPIYAVGGNKGDYFVFLNDNGTVRKQKITIGETSKNDIQVTSGIKSGDQVICSNTSTLQDGDAINAVVKQDDEEASDASK